MGQCKDCVSYSTTGRLSSQGYCSFFSKQKYDRFFDKTTTNYYYVSPTNSCSKFRQRSTPPTGGYYDDNGGCFLTSACVEYQGKADDCEELTVLRAFRDGYMRETEDGEQLVKKYYEVAPKIVEHINSSDNKNKYYQYISEVVEKCVKLIALKENERALTEYKFMVENLCKEFALI